VCCVSFAAKDQASYMVKYSGGSLPSIKSGQDLKLFIDNDQIRLQQNHSKEEPTIVLAATITEVSYGQEVHRRIGTAVGLAVLSLGIGALVAFSKSKKHYIGLTWDDVDSGKKGGIALQADKNEYRGLIAGLEGVSGRKAVNTDPPGK
jgi:hypothetical protein